MVVNENSLEINHVELCKILNFVEFVDSSTPTKLREQDLKMLQHIGRKLLSDASDTGTFIVSHSLEVQRLTRLIAKIKGFE